MNYNEKTMLMKAFLYSTGFTLTLFGLLSFAVVQSAPYSLYALLVAFAGSFLIYLGYDI
jgi:hypothetical protein